MNPALTLLDELIKTCVQEAKLPCGMTEADLVGVRQGEPDGETYTHICETLAARERLGKLGGLRTLVAQIVERSLDYAAEIAMHLEMRAALAKMAQEREDLRLQFSQHSPLRPSPKRYRR